MRWQKLGAATLDTSSASSTRNAERSSAGLNCWGRRKPRRCPRRRSRRKRRNNQNRSGNRQPFGRREESSKVSSTNKGMEEASEYERFKNERIQRTPEVLSPEPRSDGQPRPSGQLAVGTNAHLLLSAALSPLGSR